MPKGLKRCKSCGIDNGVRNKTCKNCHASFILKNKETTVETPKPAKRVLAPQGRRFPQLKYKVIHLQENDRGWFMDLFNRYKDVLNSPNPEGIWQDYICNVDPKYFIIGIRPYGFARFHYLSDGTKAICEIAVYKEYQKKGIGKKLLEDIGSPAIVSCYKEVEDFYKKNGFTWFGNVVNDKSETMEIYKK